ncbi:MAG: amino acid permease, partial [Anaerolineales bacterium]
MTEERELFLGELRLSRQLQTLGQVASVGIAVALGLSLVLPGHVLAQTGVRSAIPTLTAVLILLLTMLNITELLGGSGERGGTHALVHESLGGLSGFLTGWSVIAGYVLIGAIFSQVIGSALADIFNPFFVVHPNVYSIGFLTLVALVNLFHLLPRRETLSSIVPLATALIVILLIIAVFTSNDRNPGALLPPPGNLMLAALWPLTLYAALEAILSARRRVLNPSRRVPAAMLATILLGGLLILIIELLAPRLPGFELSNVILITLNALESIRPFPHLLIELLELSILVIALNGSIMAGARQLYTLSREGALPHAFIRMRAPFRLPPLLFVIILVAAIPVILWAPDTLIINFAAALFLIPITLVNIAAIRSRQVEPDRRRIIVLPFHPVLPVLALMLCAAILLALPISSAIALTGWLAVGLVLFFAYVRSHLIEAQHGVLVFGREPIPQKPEGTYRILVPLSAGVERQLTLNLAAALAHQTNGEVLPLQVITISDPLAIHEGRRLAQERNTLFQWSTREVAKHEVPTYPITRLASSLARGIQDTAVEEECDLIMLSWPVGSEQEGTRVSRVLDPVVRQAPCDVAVVAFKPEHIAKRIEGEAEQEEQPQEGPYPVDRILVPTAGGPHAPLATRLALLLAREFSATTRAVYVALPDATQADLEQGSRWIQQTLDRMREQLATLPTVNGRSLFGEDKIAIDSEVVQADTVADGIVKAGSKSELVFIGASEESIIDQFLFGTLPEQIAKDSPTPVVIVKRHRGLPRRWLQRLWDGIFSALPTLDSQQQMEVYKRVRRGARPDTDFFVMMGLSAVIATYGLLQGSTAVIIGAMLVAPLFTPILALSLAIVQGDIRLLRLAIEAALKGIVLAVGLAVALSALSPLRVVTSEIAVRTSPNLFDLAVALASGAAGAYALAREDVAAALPGVAIAAALVPPLGVIGVGLALGDSNIT